MTPWLPRLTIGSLVLTLVALILVLLSRRQEPKLRCSSQPQPYYTPKPQTPPLRKPALSDLVDGYSVNITGNVQFLLDFAIIGHAKCATTNLMDWLSRHEQIQMYQHELHGLQTGRPEQLVQEMYQLPDSIRGYKQPGDLANYKALVNIRKFFPKTKLIVGIRHPIRYFESFYNFRVRNGYNMSPADSKLFLHNCVEQDHGVCVYSSRFHENLSLLGKTNLTTVELQLLEPFTKLRPEKPLPNKVFLYEIGQMHDSSEDRTFRFRRDLSDFLGLNKTLNEIPVEESNRVKSKVLDICLDRYKGLRQVLQKNAEAASIWIQNYFILNPDVVVSSPEYFRELMKTWMVDPCEK